MEKIIYTRKQLLTDKDFSVFSYNNNDLRHKALEEEIINHKRIPSVYTWNHYILDGHKQYKICQDNGINYRLIELDLKSKDDALIWICRHIIDEKKYYPTQSICYCIGKYFLLECKLRNQKSINTTHSGRHNPTISTPVYVSRKIEEITGFKANTIRKYATLANNLDHIYELSPTIFKNYFDASILMSYGVISMISKMGRSDISKLECHFSSLDNIRVTPEMIQLFLNPASTAPKQKVTKAFAPCDTIPIIKTMPVYDADSVLSSLTLTIPSWVSSIERIKNTADFEHISAEAKERLKTELISLADTVAATKKRLESE